MTVKIPKSQIGPDFDLKVAHFAEEMRNWRAHMALVAEDERTGVTGINKHVPYPRPIAPEIVDAAVDEDGNPDYEIVDDGPTPEQVLAAKKTELLSAVSIAEQAAINAIVPFAKRRLFNLRESTIRQADVALAAELSAAKKGRIAKVVDAAFGRDAPSIDLDESELRARRPEEDTAHLDAQDERRRKLAAIELVAAQANANIEDLTLETIDGWPMPAFPTI